MQVTVQDINIREAIEADLNDITRIYNQAVALGHVTADKLPVTLESRREALHTITVVQKRPFWVLDINGIQAFFYLRNFYDRPAYRITAEIGIYIDEKMRGYGIGKFILNYCLNYAKKNDIENILALIFSDNRTSIQLFEKCGFITKGKFDALAIKNDNEFHDLVVLQWKKSE